MRLHPRVLAPLRALVLAVAAAHPFACSSDSGSSDGEDSQLDDAGAERPRDASQGTPDGSVSGRDDAGSPASRDAPDGRAPAVQDGASAAGDAARDGSSSPAADGAAATADGGDAGSSSTGCSAVGATTLFCEDFETVDVGEARATTRWQPQAAMATLTIEESRARARRALHVHTLGNGHGFLKVENFAPPSNSFFGRMYAFIDALPSAPNYAHYTLVEAAGTPAGLIRPIGGQYIAGQGNLLGPGSDGGPTGDWTNWKPSAPFTPGKWVCFEWQISATDNSIKVWIDGTAKPDLTVSTKVHGGAQTDFVLPTFKSVWFGWWLYQGGPTPDHYDLWLDDIALASARLGC
jgi:hypothetical protein